MATHDRTESPADELDRLTSVFTESEALIDAARKPLHEAIVKHLKARSAPPGKLADHTPYDRNHVGRIGKAAGVPSLRGPNAAPAPVYQADVEERAFAELDELTAAFEAAEAKTDEDRKLLHDAIVRHYAARALPPGVIADHTPYDRNHIGRLVKAAGAPLIRG